jgi:hypothetical protein
MWLQTASEATAIVRMLGQHTIVSQDVKYNIDELVASGRRQASQIDIPRTQVRQRVIPILKVIGQEKSTMELDKALQSAVMWLGMT